MTNTIDLEAKIFEMDSKLNQLNIPRVECPQTLRTERHLLTEQILMVVNFDSDGFCRIGIFTNPMGSYYLIEKIPTYQYNPHFNRVKLVEVLQRMKLETGSAEALSIIQK